MDAEEAGAPNARWRRVVAPSIAALLAVTIAVVVVATRPDPHAAASHGAAARTPIAKRSVPHTADTPIDPAWGGKCDATRDAALTVYNDDGSQRWTQPQPVGELNRALVSVKGLVVSGADGVVIANRASDGARVWARSLGKAIYNVWAVGGSVIVNVDQVGVAPHAQPKIVSLDVATGRIRWTYDVQGRGFLGDAQLTGDGGLAFTVPAIRSVVTLDLASGEERFRVTGANPEVPVSVGDGLVLVYGQNEWLGGYDTGSGKLRWRVSAPSQEPGGLGGTVVASGETGVVLPISTGNPPTVLTAYSLKTGAALWHYTFGYIAAVSAVTDGFLMSDGWKSTLALVDARTGHVRWTAHGVKSDQYDQAPAHLADDRSFVVGERSDIAVVDATSGAVHRLTLPPGISLVPAATGSDFFVMDLTTVAKVSGDKVVWSAPLAHAPETDVLLDGGIAVQTEDTQCVVAS